MRRATRVALAALLAFAALWPSAGDLAARALTGEPLECSMACDGSDEEGHCPPHCADGSCAKLAPAAVANATVVVAQVERRVWPNRARAQLTFEGHPRDIFHPPRA